MTQFPHLNAARPPRVAIETHGCKLNAADSQRIATELIAAGYALAGSNERPDVYVLNSCTVTHVADRKARQAISAARRRCPEAVIVATGCYAERDPETLAALAGVDLVVTNRQKPQLVEMITERLGVSLTPCGEGSPTEAAGRLLGRTRVCVKIQEGCNQVCAYCIVPTVRGRERSIPEGLLVEQVNELVRGGCREVVLTGAQLGAYGFDLDGTNLARMLRRILLETDVPRLRVSSLQPLELTRELLALWSAPGGGRLCPHFHIPLQSGSDRVLMKMRRRYTSSQFMESVRKVRAAVPSASITTDVIAGFPGETDDDFQATLRVVEEVRFAAMHVFPYSSRPGTSAAHFGKHPPAEVRAARAAGIREMAAGHARDFRTGLVGEVRPVLWERTGPLRGLTDNYVRVELDPESSPGRDRVNSIEQIELTGLVGETLTGRPIMAASL